MATEKRPTEEIATHSTTDEVGNVDPWEGYEYWSTQLNNELSSFDCRDLKESIAWLRAWQKNENTDDELLNIFIVYYIGGLVQNEVTNRFQKVVLEKLDSALSSLNK